MKTASKLLISSALLACSSMALAAPINVTYSYIVTQANQGNGGSDIVTDTATTFGSRTSTASLSGNTAQMDLTWTDLGTAAVFDFDFEQTRNGTQYSFSRTYESIMRFTATENTTYSFAGFYESDDNGDPGRLYSQVYLQDTATGQMLFRDYTESTNTVDESFVLGDIGDGDRGNLTQGAISGNLIAGRQYNLFFHNLSHTWPDADQGGTASGCLTLAIGTTANSNCGASVPAPAPLALFGLGLLLLGLRQHKHTKA